MERISCRSATVDEQWNVDIDPRRSAAVNQLGNRGSGGFNLRRFVEVRFGPPK